MFVHHDSLQFGVIIFRLIRKEKQKFIFQKDFFACEE